MREEREGEWVRIERGKPFSERKPARQIFHRRGGFRSGEAHRFGRVKEHGNVKVVRWKEGQVVRSFLVRNFPPECSARDLISKCREAGPVADLFCPNKRDVRGKRFCFVRIVLSEGEGDEDIIVKLNSLWIGSYKLQAFLPLFERKGAERKGCEGINRSVKLTATESINKEQKKEPSQVQSNAAVKEGTSFLQATIGYKCSCPIKQMRLPKTTFIPEEEESRWLENAYVGCLKNEFSWEDHRDDIKMESINRFEVKSLGEGLILILPVKIDEGWKGRLDEWGKYWCSWVRPWKPSDVGRRREVWTDWFGVPMHAWTERFFKQISLRFGSFLEWDRKSQENHSLDRARVKIWGSSHKVINETVTICIDHLEFPVTIVEVLRVSRMVRLMRKMIRRGSVKSATEIVFGSATILLRRETTPPQRMHGKTAEFR